MFVEVDAIEAVGNTVSVTSHLGYLFRFPVNESNAAETSADPLNAAAAIDAPLDT
jgi:hypothetical protein